MTATASFSKPKTTTAKKQHASRATAGKTPVRSVRQGREQITVAIRAAGIAEFSENR